MKREVTFKYYYRNKTVIVMRSNHLIGPVQLYINFQKFLNLILLDRSTDMIRNL